MSATPNRLRFEKSPYLQQHALNPVDWYPWGQEAFARARTEMKPVFLSVGYSTCHWCHVMERESFENEEIAALLNEYFVCIKVDREERPDVDRIYMTALQALGQQGGWPMSMFLTPEGQPFFGGTYFPPHSRHGRVGFSEALGRIHEVWTQQREAVLESAGEITKALADLTHATAAQRIPDTEVLERAFGQFREMFDPLNGGFGGAPKFPRPSVFEFLLRYHARTGNPEALDMVERTIQHMAEGGVMDQVGGGFHRYAVDAQWRVPHFEKMLYDQAQLARTMADLYQSTRKELYGDLLRTTLTYVARDLTGPHGEFFSAEDADSLRPEETGELGEGAFYLWTAKELEAVVGKDARLFSFFYGVKGEGNVPVDPQHEFTGRNILYQAHSFVETAEQFGRDVPGIRSTLSSGCHRLLEARENRPRPQRDDKVLASWNGMMIGAFARAGWVLGEDRWVEHARRAADFILRTHVDHTAWTVRRRYRDGDTRFEGQLDDYLNPAAGLLELFAVTQEVEYLRASIALTQRACELFSDDRSGALLDGPGEDPAILMRMRERYDGAEPAGNSVAAWHFLRLAAFTGDERWNDSARRILKAYALDMQRQPVALPLMLASLELYHAGSQQVVLTGRALDPATSRLRAVISSAYLPSAAIVILDEHTRMPEFLKCVPWAEPHVLQVDRAQVFVCRDFHCEMPTDDPGVLAALLRGGDGHYAGGADR